MTPTQRTLRLLRAQGWFCAIVEHWNAHIRRRQDLFGFADILAVLGDRTLLVQTTTGSNASKRVDKIRGIPAAKLWLASPTRSIVVHGWAKRGARGKRKVWQCVERRIVSEELEAAFNPHL